MQQNRAGGVSMGAVEWGLLLALGLVWGGSFFFAELALTTWPPLTVVLGRVLFGALLLNLVVLASGQRLPRNPALWRNLLVMGILNSVIPFCLIVWGQTQVTSGVAAILYASTSLFTVLLAPLLVKDEHLTAPRLVGVVIGLLGVAVMLGPDAFNGGGAALAEFAILGASLSYALASIWGRRFRETPSSVAAAGQLSVAAVAMLPIALMADRPWTLPSPTPGVVVGIAGLALLSTTVGYLLYFTLLRRAGAVNVSLVTLIVPPSALLLGALFLGEQIEPRDLLGLLCITLGLVVIDGRAQRWLRATATPVS